MKKTIEYTFEEGDVVVLRNYNKVYILARAPGLWRESGDYESVADDNYIKELLEEDVAVYLGNRKTGPDRG